MEVKTNIELAESSGTLKGYSNPEKSSNQDGFSWKNKDTRLSLWKARYSYSPRRTSSNSRDFCKKMVSISQSGVVYRKEDIIKMGDDGVNSELAAKGRNKYSIWLFKGGALCHHFWERRLFVRKFRGVNIPSQFKWLNYLTDFNIADNDSRAWKTILYTILRDTDKLSPTQAIDAYRLLVKPNTPVEQIRNLVNSRLSGLFSRWLTSVPMPDFMKRVLFGRYSNNLNKLMFWTRSMMASRKVKRVRFPKVRVPLQEFDSNDLEKIYGNINLPATGFDIENIERMRKTARQSTVDIGKIKRGVKKLSVMDVSQRDKVVAAHIFERTKKVLDGLVRGNDRKLGIPMSRSKTSNLENDEEIDVREGRRRAIKYPVNSKLVNTKPINMPNKGYMRTKGQKAMGVAGDIGSKVISKTKRRISSSISNKFSDFKNDLNDSFWDVFERE